VRLADLKSGFDIRRVLPVLVLAAAAAGLLLAFSSLSRLEKKAAAAERAVSTLRLKARAMARLEERLETHLRRMRVAPKGTGIVPLMEELADRLGLRDRIAGMKPGEPHRESGFVESPAEVSFEKIDLNEAVNLIYRIGNHAAFLVIRRIELRRNFQDPDRLDVSLSVSLIENGGTG